MSDIVVPLTEGDELDPTRNDGKTEGQPTEEIDAWRAEHLETEPPAGYLEVPQDV